jgi:hypothetical protein
MLSFRGIAGGHQLIKQLNDATKSGIYYEANK